jgi:hypothetical protein
VYVYHIVLIEVIEIPVLENNQFVVARTPHKKTKPSLSIVMNRIDVYEAI